MPPDGFASLPRFRSLSGEFADPKREAEYRAQILESERAAARWILLVLGVLFALEFIADALTFAPGAMLIQLFVTRMLALPLSAVCWLVIRRTSSPLRLELTMAAFWLAAVGLYTSTAALWVSTGQDLHRIVYPLMALCALLVVPGRLLTALATAAGVMAASIGFQMYMAVPTLDIVGSTVLSVTVTIIGGVISVTLRRLRRQQYAHAALLESSNRALLNRTTELEERLIQAQQLEGAGRLASVVAHESNNAFSVIVGLSDLMLSGRLEEPAREQLATVRETALNAAELTRELLTFSRQEPFRPTALRLTSFLESLRPMLETSLPKGTSLKLAVDGEHDPHVVADAAQLRHVLMNLAVNAGHAMGQAGVFAIRSRSATPVDVDACRLEHGAYVAIEAEDNGSGMSKDTLEQIFQPFFTTKRAGEGTGLGLSVVDWIMARNHGGISVTSEVGVGTVFTLLLPSGDAVAAGE